MNFGLEGKRVLVTGGSRGIGRAIAATFAAEGARVVLTYNTGATAASEAVATIGKGALALPLDLGSESSIEGVARELRALMEGVDVLVHNAVAWPGFPAEGELFETAPVARFRDSVRANLEGPYLLTRALIAEMRAARWGRIVFVSTGLVEDGFPGSAAYLSAKAGLHGLTRSMARELAPSGILTNLVMPGFTLTEGRRVPTAILEKVKAAAATGRATSPEDVARVVAFLGSAANSHVNGERIRVDGHFFAPTPA